ncbi:MAG: hypothetical protein JXA54_03620 [Candidatus Heimdallarchaeota archaeon]|nr:hypothetical protein [Candidatus Heimdallarchaeota archaeon]
MFNIKKISNKVLLIGISIFNMIIFLSFIIDLLLRSNKLPASLIIFAIPIELLSGNFLFVFSILGIEIFLITLIWLRIKKNKTYENASNEEFNFDFLTGDQINDNNDEESLDLFEANDSTPQENNNDINRNFVLEYNDTDFDFNLSESEEMIARENYEDINDDEFDLSPSYLTDFDESFIKESRSIISEELKTNDKPQFQSNKEIANDYQFAIYQNIVNNIWVYEKARDRERIGFDHNALDESQIPLSELSSLIKMGLVFKQTIQHPTGSFVVYTSNPKTEKQIINDYIRRICRAKRIRIISRKIDFLNYQELGLLKKTWQFDFEIPELNIIGCIWTDDSFVISNTNMNILTEKKEELKALIATITLKMKEEGIALIITNQKANSEIIKDFVKRTGWGKAIVLYFSDAKFIDKFTKCIEKKL